MSVYYKNKHRVADWYEAKEHQDIDFSFSNQMEMKSSGIPNSEGCSRHTHTYTCSQSDLF